MKRIQLNGELAKRFPIQLVTISWLAERGGVRYIGRMGKAPLFHQVLVPVPEYTGEWQHGGVK